MKKKLQKKNPRILVLTTYGGGGHLQLAIAREQQILKEYPDAKIIKIDALQDWGSYFGRFCNFLWNKAQIRGDVRTQESLVAKKIIVEYILWPSFFFGSLYRLFRSKIDHVIDTQPFGTSPIIKAIKIYNFIKKKNLYLEKVYVDLPSERTSSYFCTIKKLKESERKYLRFITASPLPSKGESKESFWKRKCRLTPKNIQYEHYVIRQAFLEYQGKKRKEQNFALSLSLNSSLEKKYVQEVVQKQEKVGVFSEKTFYFELAPKDLLLTISLGSQPAFQATLDYVDAIIENVNKVPKKKLYLIVLCSRFSMNKKSLFSQIHQKVVEAKDFPSNLVIIPVSFQKDQLLAPIFFRSDITLTRSGGQTSMELMAVMQGKSFIHSETKEKTHNLEKLLQGIALWEAGNAEYLMEKIGAEVVTPRIFPSYFAKTLEKLETSMVHEIAN